MQIAEPARTSAPSSRAAEARHRSRRLCATAASWTTLPRASITALMPVGVARSTGIPSSAARSRAWARCCGGPQLPNQASFDGLKMKAGRLLPVDDMAGEDDLVAKLEADLAPLIAEIDRSRARARREIEIAGREPRQADRRQQRAHRQIFAVGHQVRLVVAADDLAAGSRAQRCCWRRRRRGRRPLTRPRFRRSGAGRWGRAAMRRGCAGTSPSPDARPVRASSSGSVTAASGHSTSRGSLLGRAGQRRETPRGLLVEAGPPLVLLADVRLDDAHVPDRQRVVRNRRGGQQPQQDRAPDDDDQRQPLLVIFEPDRAAQKDDEAGQAIGADERRDRDQRRRREDRSDRIPREAGEHRAAKPFGDRPGAAEHQ